MQELFSRFHAFYITSGDLCSIFFPEKHLSSVSMEVSELIGTATLRYCNGNNAMEACFQILFRPIKFSFEEKNCFIRVHFYSPCARGKCMEKFSCKIIFVVLRFGSRSKLLSIIPFFIELSPFLLNFSHFQIAFFCTFPLIIVHR